MCPSHANKEPCKSCGKTNLQTLFPLLPFLFHTYTAMIGAKCVVAQRSVFEPWNGRGNLLPGLFSMATKENSLMMAASPCPLAGLLPRAQWNLGISPRQSFLTHACTRQPWSCQSSLYILARIAYGVCGSGFCWAWHAPYRASHLCIYLPIIWAMSSLKK
jgi:hypothetical protein